MPSNKLVQSVLRALDIVDMVANAEDGLTLREIASRLGVAAPTAHNLARTLVSRGYLEKASRPSHYHVGTALLDILRRQSERNLLLRAANELRGLSAAVPPATLVFCEPLGGEILAVLRISAERPSVLQRNYPHPMAPYASVSSLVFLAFWGRTERDEYLAQHPLDELGASRWRSREALDSFLANVRGAGYALMAPGEMSASLRIAAPVFAPEGPLVASLGLLLPADGQTSTSPEKIIELLTAATGRLSIRESRDEEG